MNNNYFNGKYNLILCTDYKLPILPKNVIVRKGKLEDVAFIIRQEELDNDEVFSGNLILNKEFDNLDKDKIFLLPLNENTIYVNNIKYSSNWQECEIDDSIIYCGSFVLWLLGNQHRSPVSLFGQMRQHRIKVKKIWDNL